MITLSKLYHGGSPHPWPLSHRCGRGEAFWGQNRLGESVGMGFPRPASLGVDMETVDNVFLTDSIFVGTGGSPHTPPLGVATPQTPAMN